MIKSTDRTIRMVGLVLLLVGIYVALVSHPVQANHPTFADGDVFVSVSNGQVQWRHPDGTLNKTLTVSSGLGYTTGMAFDAANNLYVTEFSGQNVSKFDTSGTLLGTFGSGYNCNPESILFDAAGNAYVGQPDCTADILKFDSAGNLLAAFDVAVENRGSDWIDLAADQCTMFYTSEGTSIKRFDVCTNSQLPDFVAGVLHGPAYALRLLPGGGLLVADSIDIHRLDSVGSITQTYDAPGEDCWFALNLDPDGTSFWSADFCTSNIYKFDIASGTQLLTFNTGTDFQTVFGLVVKGVISSQQLLTLPFEVGETWYVCQGYNGPVSHRGAAALDLSIDPRSFAGRLGCNPQTAEASTGKAVLAPAAGIVKAHITNRGQKDMLCLELDGIAVMKVGHLTNMLPVGTRFERDAQLGMVTGPSRGNGGYAHIHIQLQELSSGCGKAKTIPFSGPYRFQDAPDMLYSDSGTPSDWKDDPKNQWRGTALTRSR